ncbi:MAG: hypothetical protein IJC30_02595 [Alphaproteobacteria bacterium]|nr:hypothetical protein [Alphaproteobacteria bacterium]
MFKILGICLVTLLYCTPTVAQMKDSSGPAILNVVQEVCPENRKCGETCCPEGQCCNSEGFCCKECPDTILCEAQGRCIEVVDGCASCVDCR